MDKTLIKICILLRVCLEVFLAFKSKGNAFTNPPEMPGRNCFGQGGFDFSAYFSSGILKPIG